MKERSEGDGEHREEQYRSWSLRLEEVMEEQGACSMSNVIIFSLLKTLARNRRPLSGSRRFG